MKLPPAIAARVLVAATVRAIDSQLPATSMISRFSVAPSQAIWRSLCAAFLLSLSVGSFAQDQSDPLETTRQQANQLKDLADSLTSKLATRESLREAIAGAEGDEVVELQETLDGLNQDIRETRLAFEQIAVGSVDLELFQEETEDLDWRGELSQVMMPLMQNLKRITEKPRKIELLRARISLASEQQQNATVAGTNITEAIGKVSDESTREALEQLRLSWAEKEEELGREVNLARVQLGNLQRSDGSLWVQVRDAFVTFFSGRGLTLLLAAAAGFAVYYATQFAAKLFTKRQEGEDARSFRTRQRIIHYALKAVKTLLIVIAVFVVFYIRGDILLLAISFVIASGLVLSLRHAIPQFLQELRLLLNLGSIREDERVMYQGLPWKVTALNMHSVLRNPEITGVLRIPLQEMMSLTSRPSGKEAWFPASKNDYILFDDGRFLKVTLLNPEHVTLESLSGTKTMIPTAEFYGMVFENLSRSSTYSVNGAFGIGYSHQSDSVALIPQKLKRAVESELSKSDLAEHVVSVSVELKEAGASSLDFWIGVKMKSEAATAYFRIQRLIQQVSVTTCTAENWDIPFPQLTLHRV